MPAPELIDPELSPLALQRRVLALAEDPAVPLLERLRFLGIVTSNIDELYMVRIADLRRAAVESLLRVFAHRLYPNAVVDGAWLLLVTRGGELPVHERDATDLLEAVAWATERRPLNPAVRVEVEQGMPEHVLPRRLDRDHRADRRRARFIRRGCAAQQTVRSARTAAAWRHTFT